MPIFHEKHVNQGERIYVLGNENKNFVICFAFRSVCTTFAEWKQNSGLSLASMRCERKVRAA